MTIAVVVALAYAAALFLFIRSQGGGTQAGADPALTDPSASGSPSPFASRTPSVSTGAFGGNGTSDVVRASTGPPLTLHPVIPGGIARGNVPSHRVVLRASSGGPIVRVGYLVPTSLDNPIGDVKGIGTSWSVTTTAYGNPAYAELFVQAGKGGTPITCTIEVDGAVTSTATTKGPYGRQVCIG